MTLEVFSGQDLSQTVRFDTNYESLANGDFSDSSESYSNAIYIGGKGQNDDRDIYEGEVGTEGEQVEKHYLILQPNTLDRLRIDDGYLLTDNEQTGVSPSGLDRFESWDNQSSLTVESEYEAEALSMLTQYGQTLTMSGNGLAKCPYVFREQYDIGDTVTVAFSGKSAKAQILSITEHWSWGAYDISFAFGKPQNNLADQLQLMLRKIQEASNKTNSTDSVRWYTIPTDTTMPKADVTYNTIGFVGTCAEGGSTFTLYLDNEKTGAKTYHVYFKQLGGGNLTLTTGKAGASDLVLNSGTYVAIIYVDEDGNVTTQGTTVVNSITSGNMQAVSSNAVASYVPRLVEGIYTGSGGQQNPQYIGKNRVRFNMMNTSVLSDSTYKDWLLMDCYGGFDVGGATAFGISRTQLRAYIMRSNAGTSPNRPTSWAESGEVSIISAKSFVNATYSDNYVVFSNGLKIQWGRRNNSTNNGYALTFPKAFSYADYHINAEPNTYNNNVMNCYNRSKTGCTVNRASSASTDWSWFAIGV